MNKKFSVKTIVAIGIGAALFFVCGRFIAIPSPVPSTSITIQYGVLGFMACVFGPIAGALIGLIGHALIDASYGWGVWWSWVIAFALENDAVAQSEMIRRVHAVADEVNILSHLEHAPTELSGGQKQRVSLAGVMVDDVPIFLFDEPLANLDPATGKQAIELIDEIKERADHIGYVMQNPNQMLSKVQISYAVALALRYIPDIQREYHDISQSQQARGIEMSKKESLVKRLKSASAILIPLILSSMDRIETISNAMELRSFGKGKKRTWYRAKSFRAADILSMVLCALLLALAIVSTTLMGTRFYNPFLGA